MEKCEITTSMKGIIGSTEIGFSKEYINRRIRTMNWALIFALMGFFVLVGLGLYEFMSRSVFEPLEAFTETVKGMNSEDLSARVKIRRKDEIGVLAASFNQMASNLEKSHRVLRKSEDRFRTIFNAVNDAIFVHDLETGVILDVNSRMCEMYGYSREEIRQLNIEALSMGEPPYTQQDALSWIKKAAGGQFKIFEWRARRKPGDFFWADVSMTRAEIGGQDRLLVVVRDITERKRAEENLRETNEFLENILNSSTSISIVSTDLKGNILFWNKGAENIFGYSAEEIVGRQKTDILYHDDETKKLAKEIRSLILKNKRGTSIDIKETKKDGCKLWMNLNLTPRFDGDGHIIGILGIGQDISGRKQAEDALHKAHDKLEVKVEERTKNLKEKTEKLGRMNKLFVDRELRMKELKEEIKELKRKMQE
jgi:PAS domain S-box-containing protein